MIKVSDKLRVTSGYLARHSFHVGTEVTVVEVFDDGGVLATDMDLHQQYLYPEDFELIKVAPEPETLGEGKKSPDGGPQQYYDFDQGWKTLNDIIEWLSYNKWGDNSWQLGNIFKATFRWGDKEGTSKEYDARKIIYYGFRLLNSIVGVGKSKEYLQQLLDDQQFKD